MKRTFDDILKEAALSQNRSKSVGYLLQSVFFPLLIAALGGITPALWAEHAVIVVAAWFSLAFIFAVLVYLNMPAQTDVFYMLHLKKQDEGKLAALSQRIAELEARGQNLYYKNIASFFLRSMSVEYVKGLAEGAVDRAYFYEMIDEILAPLYLEGDAIFGFTMSERWSLSIYLHNAQCRALEPVWRRKSNSHPATGLGRSWVSGEGHVGKAFLSREPILTGNANEPSVAQLCKARGSKQHAYDDDTYVSFASVPITMSGDRVDPHGVLVITSNQIDRFSEESTTELLMHFAETIALIIELSNVDVSCLIYDVHAKVEPKQGG